MWRGHRTFSLLGMAFVLILARVVCAAGSDTEEQLIQRIQKEQNPVKKAKEEIKLANLKLDQLRGAYSQGHVEAGAKLLGTFMDDMKSSWKTLQNSGRKVTSHPEGFRELEISLRENVRLLQDLGRDVSYFDREPIMNAAQQLDHMRSEVLGALFPAGNPRNRKDSAFQQTATDPPQSPPNVQ